MSDDILARAEQAMEGVTVGPWYVEPETEVQAFVLTDTPTEVSGARTCVAQRVDYPDAAFIAAAPSLVRDLVAALREARAEVERLRESVSVYVGHSVAASRIADRAIAERDEAWAAIARVRALTVFAEASSDELRRALDGGDHA